MFGFSVTASFVDAKAPKLSEKPPKPSSGAVNWGSCLIFGMFGSKMSAVLVAGTLSSASYFPNSWL